MILEKYILPDKYKTGHDGLDDQHAHLFSIMVGMLSVIKQRPLTMDNDIHQLLTDLHTYTRNHFKYEERVMEKIQYPDLLNHREIHIGFVEKLIDIQKNAVRKNEERLTLLSEMIIFVREWYLEHVLIEDKKMVAYKDAMEQRTK